LATAAGWHCQYFKYSIISHLTQNFSASSLCAIDKTEQLEWGFLLLIAMKKSASGFTLIELIIAMALATGILAMAGGGLMAIMARDKQAAADRANRYELQRTIDFLGQEIRMAASVSPCPTAKSNHYQPATGSTNTQPILVLNMPASSGLTAPIVYYLAAPPPQDRTVWDGPLVLYRWGPTLLLNGDYSKNTNTNTYDFYNELVIDRVTTSISNSTCPTNYAQNIPASGAAGFSLCLAPQGRSAQLMLSRYGSQQKIISTLATFSPRSRAVMMEAGTCPAT
jgi:prepilin-type N-terminal cleavage/methylation domain-containing protein